MAYVFGIEGIPLFEMQFIILILMFAGLIVIFFEMKKLTKLLSVEKTILKQFESDLDTFEHNKKKGPSDELLSYIQKARAQKIPDYQIEQALLKYNWSRKEIEEMLKKQI